MKSDRGTKDYYEKNARLWTERKTNSFHHQAQFERFVKELPERANVLDIGCAAGIHVPLFLGIGRKLKYHGIDVTNAFLKLARKRYPQLTFDQADILDSRTLPRKKFGGFWAGAVLMHIRLEQWPKMFDNIEQVMRKGAIGYVSLPVAHPSGQATDNDPRHFTILSEAEQRERFKERNWKIITSGTLDGFTTEAVWRWYIVRLP